ncbi:hypothetical protein [Mycobacteroides abscessus]|uniref:hypothetical protein n=1 Tax=Mycobacteroides abscessus TaxID=36809 RepID=UPI0009A62B68|nr:hypothetical protein [Mycobacteroides abscessus]RIT48805.1 hypothetical protein D2E80_11915 [Mycobacteroides abscessus]SKT87853.1 Uncharacterised protein [Mycobacteroides abscessus subsp. massiliense]SKU07620.1 Uncharacterised protein [Mycobacteroides abscessus subsp. massiliense]
MASLVFVAKSGSYEDFLKEYTPADATYLGAGGRSLLFQSVANQDIPARIAITTRLLDDGADASVVSNGINVLHVLFGVRNHDAEQEAPMLRRLIDGGADINLFSKRSGPPLAVLIQHGPSPESECIPFYDVIFDQPNLDLSSRYLRDLIFNSAWNLPILREYVAAYEASRKQG